MNKKLEKQLRLAFSVPQPKKKSEFLSSLRLPSANRFEFVLDQIGYIRKRVWVSFFLLVISVMLGLHFCTDEYVLKLVWLISSVFPFISLICITEIARSASHNMAELEMSCMFKLSDVVLSRLGILSGAYLTVFTLIVVLFLGKADYGVFRLCVYLLAPFLLTCALSLFAVNRLRVNESPYICGLASCVVSASSIFLSGQYDAVFSTKYLSIWNIAFVGLLILTVAEAFKFIKKTEELQWSLLLTD